MQVTVTIEGANEIKQRLDAVLPAIRFGTRRIGNFIKMRLQEYPAERHGPLPGGFVSDRQRRFFFAALRDGRITVPYQRTYGLMQAWQQRFADMAGGAQVEIYNLTVGGEYVQGPQSQALYHRITGWQTTQKVVDDHANTAAIMLAEDVNRALGGAMFGGQ